MASCLGTARGLLSNFATARTWRYINIADNGYISLAVDERDGYALRPVDDAVEVLGTRREEGCAGFNEVCRLCLEVADMVSTADSTHVASNWLVGGDEVNLTQSTNEVVGRLMVIADLFFRMKGFINKICASVTYNMAIRNFRNEITLCADRNY